MTRVSRFFYLVSIALIFNACASGKIKDGKTAYELKQYSHAISLLKKEYNDESHTGRKGELAYLIADSYLYLTQYHLALEWSDLSAKNAFGNKAILQQMNVLTKLEKYDEALNLNTKLLQVDPQNPLLLRKKFQLEGAKRTKAESSDYVVKEWKSNSGYYDYSPTIYENEFLVFSSDREDATGRDRYKWTNHKFSDLYISQKNGNFVRPFDALINSENNEGTVAFSQDYNTMIFSSCQSQEIGEDVYCSLYQSKRVEGVWEAPIRLSFCEKEVNYGHPTLIESDSVLVFSRNGKTAATGYDLWYSSMTSDGFWSEPFEMPNTINTQGNELFATSHLDTLYFSSDYLAGLGGLDIFKTYLENGKWTTPVHLPYPINSGADDFGFVVDQSARLGKDKITTGFFTSSRNAGSFDDIFSYDLMAQTDDDDSGEEDDNTDDLAVYLAVKAVTFSDPDDVRSKANIRNGIVELEYQVGNTEQKRTNRGGLAIFEIPSDKDFELEVRKEGYYTEYATVSSKNLNGDDQKTYTLNLEVVLRPILLNTEITLPNILYDFNESFIRDDAKPTLDSLSNLMLNNPSLVIELGSHTDCRGDEELNQKLSQDRANAAIQYIIGKGISRARLAARGYGKSSPKAKCICDDCTELEHEINRRTTFKVTKY